MKKSSFLIPVFMLLASSILWSQSYSVTVNSEGGFKFSGDYSGMVYAQNFTIGPYDAPFTVMLEPIAEIERTGCGGSGMQGAHWVELRKLNSWLVDGAATDTADITLSTSETNPQINATAVWKISMTGDGSFTMSDSEVITWFCPPRTTALVGEVFAMDIYLIAPAYSFIELAIDYNPAILQVEDVVFFSYETDIIADYSTPGRIILIGTSPAHDNTCTINWRAVGDGSSDLSFEFLQFTVRERIPVPHGGFNPVGYPYCRATVQKSLYLYGDINVDGVVNIVDALMVAQHYVGVCPCRADRELIDVNRDGSINIVDALIIARYYVGLERVLPL